MAKLKINGEELHEKRRWKWKSQGGRQAEAFQFALLLSCPSSLSESFILLLVLVGAFIVSVDFVSRKEENKDGRTGCRGSILEVFLWNWPCGDKSLFSTVSSAKSAAKEFSSPDGTLGVEMPVAGYEESEWETERNCGVRIAYGLFQDLDSATSILRQE